MGVPCGQRGLPSLRQLAVARGGGGGGAAVGEGVAKGGVVALREVVGRQGGGGGRDGRGEDVVHSISAGAQRAALGQDYLGLGLGGVAEPDRDVELFRQG